MFSLEMVYIKLYLDDLEALEPYGDAERGRLFTALLEYAKTGEASHLSGNERFIFPMMKARLDRDREALENLSAQRSEAGKKGALAKAGKSGNAKQCLAKPSNAKQGLATLSKSSNDKDKDNNEDKDNSPPKAPQGAGDGFAKFWQAYPRRVGKASALKAWEKLSPDDGLTEKIIGAVERQKRTDQWQRDDGRYIPHPATWLNQRRWEDELEPVDEELAPTPVHVPMPEEDRPVVFTENMDWRDLV